MGRRRTSNPHLPSGVYFSRGWHFWRDADTGVWHKLGRAWDRTAKDEWIKLTEGKAPHGTVSELLDAYMRHADDLVRQIHAQSRPPDTTTGTLETTES